MDSSPPILLLALALLMTLPYAAGDPAVTAGGQGSLDIVWNFQNAANYTLNNTQIGGAQLSLRDTVAGANYTTQADFSSYSAATNIDLLTRPGDVLLKNTSVSLNATYDSRVLGGPGAANWRSIT